MSDQPTTLPSPGRIVHYTLSDHDAAIINERRMAAQRSTLADSGVQMHNGNTAHPGQVYPMVIVRVWSPGLVNGKVLLDGTDDYWATSVHYGEDNIPGRWYWPPRT